MCDVIKKYCSWTKWASMYTFCVISKRDISSGLASTRARGLEKFVKNWDLKRKKDEKSKRKVKIVKVPFPTDRAGYATAHNDYFW